MISNYTEILKYLRKHKITVGAFNSFNMETLQAVIQAAEKKQVPLIVQTFSVPMRSYAGPEFMRALYAAAAQKASVRIAHGTGTREILCPRLRPACIDAGYTGVMIDLASEDYEKNVEETRKVVALAHAKGVSVGSRTGSDCGCGPVFGGNCRRLYRSGSSEEILPGHGSRLSGSFGGNGVGTYAHKPKINFELLKELIDTVYCPIVVHGGSGTPEEDVEEMVRLGVAKLNVGTDFFDAYRKAIADILEEKGPGCDVIEMMAAAREAVEKVALQENWIF